MTDTKQPEGLRLAHDIGANLIKIESTERTRVLFEAWMRGHCWLVSGNWNGSQYVHPIEADGEAVHPPTMNTRQLFAAFRDGLAVQEQQDAIGADGVTGLRNAAIEPDMHWISGDEEPVNFDTLHEVALELAERAYPAGSRIKSKINCAKSLPTITLAAWYDENEDLQYEVVGAAIAQEGGK